MHKINNSGRPVISSIECNSTKLSKYLDYYIQPLVKEIKSSRRNITDFLKNNDNKIISQ